MDLNEGCDYLTVRHNSFCNKVVGMRTRFTGLLAALQAGIAAVIAVPQAAIDNAINALNAVDTGIDDTLPDNLKYLMQQECFRPLIPPAVQDRIAQFTSVTELPVVLTGKLLKSIKSGLKTVSRDALNSILAGIAAGHVSEYNGFIQRSGLGEALDVLDYTYQCLTAICGHVGVTDCGDDARTLLNLRSDNTFDTAIFGVWNGDPIVVTQLNQVNDALDVKEAIIDALSF